MEANKDQALRCIEIAEKYIQQKNKKQAEKFLHRAERLFSTQKAKDLLVQVSIMPGAPEPDQQARQRKTVPKENASLEKPGYSKKDLAVVQRITSCKDYYEILGVSTNATDREIQQAYHKMALKVHSDKNKAPGADEAFKALVKAKDVLIDGQKRREYDSTRNQPPNYNRPFDTNFNADEFFNMYFNTRGGGSNGYARRERPSQRQPTAGQHEGTQRKEQQERGMGRGLTLVLVITILILLAMSATFYLSDPAYSLSANSKYPIMRRTEKLNVPYYLKKNHPRYGVFVKRIEQSIEENYVLNLKNRCDKEVSYRDSMIWKAKEYGEPDLLKHVDNFKMLSCKTLRSLKMY